ncbi:DUF1904 family protein [Paenibacillus athensensis]|uniref:DUF1904 domain-containing protein n=1 Tax=Paenibacillus athensensis TaxID=1967502 RepID=A0A4Y8Q4D3_9BACL|nr:DUF1904 family protein [Paenibacillus athensensis]MCD1261067.1 DUF1904 family protein [Paenibacillus athensensis]
MPRLSFRGITVEQLCAVSEPLVAELAAICECGTDNFTLECIQAVAVSEGKTVAAFPFVEVGWFERGASVRQRFANAVFRHVKGTGVADMEVAFVTYRPSAYYMDEDQPCGEEN